MLYTSNPRPTVVPQFPAYERSFTAICRYHPTTDTVTSITITPTTCHRFMDKGRLIC